MTNGAKPLRVAYRVVAAFSVWDDVVEFESSGFSALGTHRRSSALHRAVDGVREPSLGMYVPVRLGIRLRTRPAVNGSASCAVAAYIRHQGNLAVVVFCRFHGIG